MHTPLRLVANVSAPRVLTPLAFCTAAVLFVAIGTLSLRVAQPAEDAYILYRYAEHVAQGAGVVFNLGGPRAEGATDFLWMLLLAGANALGIDVVLAALIANAFGAGLAAAVLAGAMGARASPSQRFLIFGTVVIALVSFHGALAAYDGFSSLMFGGLALSMLATQTRLGMGSRRLAPYLALLVALMRPDGTVLATVAFAITAFTAYREQRLTKVLRLWAPAALLGAGYFIWRYCYFGLLLPLPLYVKSRPTPADNAAVAGFPLSALLPSLRVTWLWFSESGAWVLSMLVGVGFWLARKER